MIQWVRALAKITVVSGSLYQRNIQCAFICIPKSMLILHNSYCLRLGNKHPQVLQGGVAADSNPAQSAQGSLCLFSGPLRPLSSACCQCLKYTHLKKEGQKEI